MSYVDLHLHLLPGVDDGPADEAASLGFAAALSAAGVREATVTPHVAHARFPLDVTTIGERTATLQAALDRERHPAGAASGRGDPPQRRGRPRPRRARPVAHGPAGARWVLLEVPFGGISRLFLDACRHVRGQGLGLVIAHPERAAASSTAASPACAASWPPAPCCR